MNGLKPALHLVIFTLIFLLFAVIFLPVIIRELPHPAGRWIYGLFAAVCILLALRLRRALSELDS
jgi:hypothetical protein